MKTGTESRFYFNVNNRTYCAEAGNSSEAAGKVSKRVGGNNFVIGLIRSWSEPKASRPDPGAVDCS